MQGELTTMQNENEKVFTTCFSEEGAKSVVDLLRIKGYKSWYKPVFFVMPFNTVYYVYIEEV